MKKSDQQDLIKYSCPKCKRQLTMDKQLLNCGSCDRTYSIVDEIPDFLSNDSQTRSLQILDMAKKVDKLAFLYESKLWYQFSLKLAGAHKSSIKSIADFHSETLKNIQGNILDVACGTATYSRRLAKSNRNVYGIDISLGMLKKGISYIKRNNISGVNLCRANVDDLPFEDSVFDGVICSGSLHLFPDTVKSLIEISRTMKPGAPLSVQTFIEGNTIINRILKRKAWVHSFKLNELQLCLTGAGFERFQPKFDGPIFITFSVNKNNN